MPKRARLLQYLTALVLPLLANGLMGADGIRAQAKPKLEITPQVFHQEVKSVAFSPDGARLLSGSTDNTLKLWDVASGQLLRTLEHGRTVRSVDFSPDGIHVVSGGRDALLKLWDVATGELLRTYQGHTASINSVVFSPGAHVLSGSGDKTLKLWDVVSGQLLRTFEGHADLVNSVAFSRDGTRVLSGSGDKTLKLWDVVSGQLLRTFEGHAGSVTSVAFSPDGAHVLSGSEDKTLKLWDAASGQLQRTEGQSDQVTSVAFSPDGTHLVSAARNDQTLKLWQTDTGQLVRTFQGHSAWVNSVAFSRDGTRVLSGSGDKTLKLWDVISGQVLRTFGGRLAAISSVAFSPAGNRLVSSNGDFPFLDTGLSLWDSATGQRLRTFEGHSEEVNSVAFSADGARALSGSTDETLKLWDVVTGQPLRTFAGAGWVTSVAFSPDGSRLLSGNWDKVLQLWDAATGQLLRTFEGHSKGILSVAFSPDGTRVLSGSVDKTLKLWEVASGKLLRTFEGHSDAITSVAFSPDGSRLLSGSRDYTTKAWNAATGELQRTFQGDSIINSVAFSPDGIRVLSGGYKTLWLWDAETGQLVRTFEGHAAKVTSGTFSPDGRRIVSGSLDTTIRFWAPTGDLLGTLIGGKKQEWLAITPKGFFAASEVGAEMVAVVRGLELTTIGQIHQSLFNPDLLREALAGDPAGEVLEAAKVMNLETVIDSGPAPRVTIISHPATSESAGDVVTLQARITDRGKGVGRIEWRVNGVTAAVRAKPPSGGPDYEVSQQLALDRGDNTIEVVAYNGRNLLASLPAHTTIKFTGPADLAKPKLHILAIGINTYVDRGWTAPGEKTPSLFPPLGLAVKDASTFGADMKRAGGARYEEVLVTYALDTDATKANLDKIVSRLANEIHPRDTFILFAAAHGYSVGGRYFLIPQDYQGGENPEALARDAVGQDMLQDWLANRIRAKKGIVLLDTCRSGALVAGHLRPRESDVLSEAAIGRLHEATGRPVLTAAALSQDAQEGFIASSGVRHGLFTWALLDALRNGDINGNDQIELSELVAHVQSLVPKLAAQLGGTGRSAFNFNLLRPAVEQSARFGSRGEDFTLVSRLR